MEKGKEFKKAEQRKIWKDVARFFVIPLMLFLIVVKAFNAFASKFIVNPLLSYVDEPSARYDIALLTLLLIVIIPVIRKMCKGAFIPRKWILLMLLFVVCYIGYRIEGKAYIFTSSSIANWIKLMDYVFAIPIILLFIVAWKEWTKCQTKKSDDCVEPSIIPVPGFEVDEAKDFDKESDSLNRTKFIDGLVEKIKNTDAKNGSFPIGVVAKWGTGKTSFIKSLKKKMDAKEFVVMELNAWKNSSPSQMIDSFFKLLKEHLQEYSFTINNKIDSYSKLLLKGTKYQDALDLSNVADIFSDGHSIQSEYDTLKREIERIKKKIVVIIDDLDRLDKKETYEVIRLVRNSANFPNTFFIVAYDRNYILNSIDEMNTHEPHYYLEKIFQIEFTLPPIDKETIQREISKRMEPILTEKGKRGYLELVDKAGYYFYYNIANITPLFVHNVRDVVRFVNSFQMNYEYLKDEIFFLDFYRLELIRFKHPQLFADIYRIHRDIFTTDIDNNERNAGTTYTLSMVMDGEKITNESHLHKHLAATNKFYKLSEEDILTICSAYASIFSNPRDMLQARKDSEDAHLSVINPSMFDRYFFLGIEGQLSEVEFSNMRKLPAEKFIKQAKEKYADSNLNYEFNKRLEGITTFDDSEDFKKIVTVIFNLSNYSEELDINKMAGRFINYEADELAKLLGDEQNRKYFNNNNEYKDFINPFMQNSTGFYRFSDDFLKSLVGRNYYYFEKLFRVDELVDMSFNNFKATLKLYSKLNNQIWYHLWACVERAETNSRYNLVNIQYPVQIRAIRLMRKFIVENDMDGFIVSCVHQSSPFDQLFKIEGAIKPLFKTVDLFTRYLKFYRGPSVYKEEFIGLYEEMKKPGKTGVPKSFFKHVPVKYTNEINV